MARHRCFRILVFSVAIAMHAGLATAAERFADNGDGTVTDNELGLMWSRADNNGNVSWHQAEKWVLFTFPYTVGKQYDNWRMPTLSELKSLVHNGRDEPGYETDCGQRVKIIPLIRLSCGWVWSSETDSDAPTAAVFNFDNVYHYKVRKAHYRGYRALAVRDVK